MFFIIRSLFASSGFDESYKLANKFIGIIKIVEQLFNMEMKGNSIDFGLNSVKIIIGEAVY